MVCASSRLRITPCTVWLPTCSVMPSTAALCGSGNMYTASIFCCASFWNSCTTFTCAMKPLISACTAVCLSGHEPATAPVGSRICSEPCVIAGAPDCAKSGSAKNKHTKRAEGLSINPSVTTQYVEAIGWPKRDSVRFQRIASCAIWNGLGKSTENARRAYGKMEKKLFTGRTSDLPSQPKLREGHGFQPCRSDVVE